MKEWMHCMQGWMDGCMDAEWMYCMQGWMDECTVNRDGWMNGC